MRKLLLLLSIIVLLFAVSCPGEGDPSNELPDFPGWGIGINIGNTFDSLNTNNVAGETGWGNPHVSRDYIKALKAHGFKTIRLPVSWVDYMDEAPKYTIEDIWMRRVEEVVNWILAEDMYCILNLHHDGGGDFGSGRNPSQKYWIKRIATNEDEVSARFAAVWEQIAGHFKNFSDKLILESMNEVGFDDIWNRYAGGQAEQKAEAYRLLNKLNKIFVDTVRATGGRNASRPLLIAGYWTDITNSCDPLFQMPQDTVEDKLVLSVHYYTPWNFCDGSRVTWGSQSEINELNRLFGMLKTNFIDNGVPIILGEYGVNTIPDNPDREPNRVKWMTAVNQICVDMGICPVLWDIGSQHRNRIMGDIDRNPPYSMSNSLKEVWKNLKLPGSD